MQTETLTTNLKAVRLRSNPSLKFEINKVTHHYSWDKNNPKTLGGMMYELIKLNYFHYGIELTDKRIRAALETLKKEIQ